MQADVEVAIELLFGAGALPTVDGIKAVIGRDNVIQAPALAPPVVDLSDYDALLGRAPSSKEETGT